MNISIKLKNKNVKNKESAIWLDVTNGRAFRKRIEIGIAVLPKDWNDSNKSVRKSNPNYSILNQRLREVEVKMHTAIAKFDAKQFTESEVMAYLKGKTDFSSIEDYIETEIKNTRSSATYRDYKNTINALKLHTGFEGKLGFEDVNFSLLDKFKRTLLKKGRSGSTVNSYMTKIRAIMNDAYDKRFIFEKFEINKKLRVPSARPKAIKTCTSTEFMKAIDKIKTIYDWQSLAFYLLMFCTRGMYPADIVNFRKANFQNGDADNPMSKFCDDGYDYLVHRRTKTKDKSNEDMFIRIDEFPTMKLIQKIRYSIFYTHAKNRSEILAIGEELGIFKYNTDTDYDLHSNVWDVYKKRITKLLGCSFKTARKTFNTYALELEVSDTIRRVLLGHIDDSMLSHYDNLNTAKIRGQVEDAHISVLKAFEVDKLMDLLCDKLSHLEVSKWVYDDTVILDENSFINSLKD